MESCKTRKTVWWIAIVDLTLTSVSLLALIYMVLVATVFTAAVTADTLENGIEGRQPDLSQKAGITLFVWLAVVIFGAVVIVQLVAAVKLLNASQEGKDRIEAVVLCKFWRAVTAVFTVLILLRLFFSGEGILGIGFGAVNVVVRCSSLYYVQRFMQELIEGTTLPLYQPAEDKLPPP